MPDKFKIGAGLALDGEKEFKSAITSINKDLNVLGSEMKKVTAQFDGNADSMEALTAKQEVYNKRADEQRKKIEVMTAALESAKKEFGENSDKVKDWQIKLNNAEADLAKTEKAIHDTTDQLQNFSEDANDGGDAIEKAGKQAKESGDSAEKGKSGWSKLGEGLKGIGKLAGEAVLALGAAAAGAAAGIGAMTIKAAQSADEINTLSKQTGLSTEQIQKFQFASETIDVPLETLTGSMAKLTKNMATAKKGTGDASAAFKALGISVTDSNGELRNNQDVFNEAIDALGKMENETQRDAYAMQIFGKSAQELNPLILGGADALEALGNQAEDAGLILGQDALNNLNELTDQMDRFKSTTKGGGSLFATAFAGPMAEGIGFVTNQFQELTKAFSDGGFDGLADKAGEVLSNIIGKITEELPRVIELGTTVVLSLVNGIVQNLPQMVQAAIQVISQLAQGLSEALPELIPTIVDAVLLIVDTLISNVDMLVDAALNIILALADGLITAMPVLIEKIPQIIEGLLTAITENMPKILEAGVKIVVMLAGGIIKAIPSLVKSIPQLIAAVLNALGSLITSAASVGVNMVSGLWKGISGSLTWIKDKIKGWVGNVLDFVKKLFGIASPSKVFAEMGGFLSAGLAKGITDKSGLVDSAMGRLGDKLTADANVSVTAASQTRSASGYVVTNLYMDSAIVASKTSSAQFKKNAGRARSYGVVPG